MEERDKGQHVSLVVYKFSKPGLDPTNPTHLRSTPRLTTSFTTLPSSSSSSNAAPSLTTTTSSSTTTTSCIGTVGHNERYTTRK